ncbi:MAG: amino-acid racemase [Dictyoglomus sp. NZ13-RE01]|nr:MAG: amino-acid racemase [Dictyoglomus sp. NZ13-RE01]
MAKKFPCLEINLEAIYNNAKVIVEIAKNFGIKISAVTKVSLGDPKIAEILLKAGVCCLADSRVESIKKMKKNKIETEFLLIRSPSFSQIKDTLLWSDISLNSELIVLERLEEYARKIKKKHKVILMVEMGDLREGIWDKKELYETIKRVNNMSYIELVGIGTNFTCFGGIIPTESKIEEFNELVSQIEKDFAINLPIISGGNSSSIPLLFEGKLKGKINHLRIGEAIMLGRDTVYRKPIPNGRTDTFIIYAEIIELKEKPSLPWGLIGEDAFGHKPTFIDKGIRKRAILNIGRQDIDPKGLIPSIDGVEILGATSDHLILDITERDDLKVGDVIGFYPNYSSLLLAFTSPFVKKIYKGLIV